MAQGIYLVIPKGQFQDVIPTKVQQTYSYTEQVDDGNGGFTTNTVIPTWEQVAAKQKANFGEVIEVEFGGNKFMLMELELSFLSGEIADLVTLKGNKVFPRYRLLTNKEAKRFVRGDLTAADETA